MARIPVTETWGVRASLPVGHVGALLHAALLVTGIRSFVRMPPRSGLVAFVVPWLLRPDDATPRAAGLLPLCVGAMLLLWCVRDFHVAGRGTLAPWAPPERLSR